MVLSCVRAVGSVLSWAGDQMCLFEAFIMRAGEETAKAEAVLWGLRQCEEQSWEKAGSSRIGKFGNASFYLIIITLSSFFLYYGISGSCRVPASVPRECF